MQLLGGLYESFTVLVSVSSAAVYAAAVNPCELTTADSAAAADMGPCPGSCLCARPGGQSTGKASRMTVILQLDA